MCDCYVVGVLFDCNSCGGLCYVYEQLCVGLMFKIGGLCNYFELDEIVFCIVLVVGGIGVMFIVCMVCCLVEYGKMFLMLYCVCLCVEVVFVDELVVYGEVVCFYLDVEVGGLFDLKVLFVGYLVDMYFYCCGFGLMLWVFEVVCEVFGYINVYIECFVVDFGVELVQDGEYQVKFVCNGVELCVLVGKLLFDVLLEIGVEVEYSCKEGVCGFCEMCVFEGELDYCDSVFFKSECVLN